MDPVSIAIIGTLSCGIFLKIIETRLSRTGSSAILDYDKRWSNSNYVQMVHKTREKELELGLLGVILMEERGAWLRGSL